MSLLDDCDNSEICAVICEYLRAELPTARVEMKSNHHGGCIDSLTEDLRRFLRLPPKVN
jgi:hypothetical protein